MKNYDTYSELIYLVIDGEASDVERSAFYSALSENPELQNEFQTAMKLNRAAESYPKKSTVPISVTDKLFSKAGLVYMPVDSAIIAASASKNAIFGKFASYTMGKLGFILFGLIIGAGLMYLLNDNSGDISINTNAQVSKIRQIEFVQPESKIPVMSSVSENEIPNTKKYQSDYIAANDYKSNEISEIEVNDSERLNTKNFENISEIVYNQDYFSNLMINELKNKNEPFKVMDYENIYLNNITLFTFIDNIEISLENSIPWFVPEASISPKSYNQFNNLGLRILYKTNDVVRLGLSINQSTFFADFITSEFDGNIYNYRIQPNLTTISSEVLINLIRSEDLTPYIQLSVGANQAGIIFSPAMGVEYTVVESLSLYFSGTLDYFRFRQNDNWFDTQKFRLNYGINLKL